MKAGESQDSALPPPPCCRLTIATPAKPSTAADGSGIAVIVRLQLCRVLVSPALWSDGVQSMRGIVRWWSAIADGLDIESRLGEPVGEMSAVSHSSSYRDPLPENLESAVGLTRDELEHHLRLMAALKMFELGKVSSGKAAELAGMSRVDFFAVCGRYRVSIYNYPPEEVAAELGKDFEALTATAST